MLGHVKKITYAEVERFKVQGSGSKKNKTARIKGIVYSFGYKSFSLNGHGGYDGF
jgi:hypothetical protein